MDPNILVERLHSLKSLMKMHNAVALGVGTISVSTVVALIGMVYLTTTQLSNLESTFDSRIDSLESKFGNLEAKFDLRIGNLEAKFGNLEAKFDAEIATRQ